jgi:hypothetical protein
MISSATRFAWLIGMEKPTPMFPLWVDEDDDDPADAMATLTPMISPWALTSAPPELPGLMAASVWMTLMLMESWAEAARPGLRRTERVLRRTPALGRGSVGGGGGRGLDGAVHRGDDAVRDGAAESQRRPDGDGRVADVDGAGVTEGCRRQSLRVDLDDGQVGERVRAHDGGLVDLAVVGADLDGGIRRRPVQGDHVRVGQDVALGVQDDARAGAP